MKTATLPATMPNGISIRKYATRSSIRISFKYKNVLCREYLNLEPTSKRIEEAHGIRCKIIADIERNIFDYKNYFPDSPKVKMFCETLSTPADNLLMSELFEKQLDKYKIRKERKTAKKKIAHSTYIEYEKTITNCLIPAFGHLKLSEIKTATIKDWLKAQTTTLKTIRNKFALLNAVLKNAVADELIEKNPASPINDEFFADLAFIESDYKIDPFNEYERRLILDNCEGQVKNLFQFAFWSGLRTSELVALEWSDIDFDNDTINVNKAMVRKELQGTKTKSGNRMLLMLPKAREALLNQKQYTHQYGREVFFNPNTNKSWANSTKVGEVWRNIVSKLNIEFRNSYQTRHTYASMLLSNGEVVAWVANQMGHIDTEMVMKVYGKWIPQNVKGGYQLIGEY